MIEAKITLGCHSDDPTSFDFLCPLELDLYEVFEAARRVLVTGQVFDVEADCSDVSAGTGSVICADCSMSTTRAA